MCKKSKPVNHKQNMWRWVLEKLCLVMFVQNRNVPWQGHRLYVVAHLNTRQLFSSPWGFLTFFSPCWGLFHFHPPSFFVPPFSLCVYWGSRSGAYRTAVLSLKSQSLASGKNTSWALMQSGHTRSSALRLYFLDFYLQDKSICWVVQYYLHLYSNCRVI